MKKQSAFRIAFPVSAVWFGAIVGPSMISGVYESVYFAPYGAWGIILPMIAMGIAAVVIGMGANVARRFRVYDYNSYSKKLYGKFSKILTPVLEIYMVIAMIVGGSAVIAMSSTFLNDLLGIPQLGGALIMAVICIVLVLWGAGLVRSASSLMSVVMIAGLVILAVLIISERSKELGTIISTWYAPEKNSFWIGLGARPFQLLQRAHPKRCRTKGQPDKGLCGDRYHKFRYEQHRIHRHDPDAASLLSGSPNEYDPDPQYYPSASAHGRSVASDSLYGRYAARARLKRRSSAPRGRFAPAGRLSCAYQEHDRKKYDLRYHLFYRMYPYFIFGAFQYRQYGLFHSGLCRDPASCHSDLHRMAGHLAPP